MLNKNYFNLLLPVMAGGAEGTTSETTTGMLDNILSGAETMLDFGGMVLDYVFAHPVLVVFAGVGFISLGVHIAHMFMNMAKSAGH